MIKKGLFVSVGVKLGDSFKEDYPPFRSLKVLNADFSYLDMVKNLWSKKGLFVSRSLMICHNLHAYLGGLICFSWLS